MSPNRKLLGAAAFSLALAGGGVAGAVLGTPTLSGAQDETDETTTTEDFPRFEHRGDGLAAAAEALGISEADLRAALDDGKSIAQVAEEQGVDVQTVVDALVADATARLDELEASLPERMADLVNRTGWGDHRPGGHVFARMLGLETAADAIGITADDLRTALQDGSTIAEVAAANDVDVQTVIDALVAEATTRIDEAVADGRLDADRAETMKANLEERITARVNGEDAGPGEGFGPGGFGHRGEGPRGEMPADDDAS
jgi:uncharacterized protein YidB (DUF937 family)